MFQVTKSLLWLPLYFLFLYLVIRQHGWNTIWVVLFAAIMILVSDQLANLFKETFLRLRPSHEPGLMVHLVNAYKGGTYGFYSSHASNTFAIAVFLMVLIGRRYRWIGIVALPWALLMSYTRIYLGVHFPGDILAGIVMGGAIGYLSGRTTCYFLFHRSRHSRSQQ